MTSVECHLGCAGLADRGVPTRTRHHNDGNRGRFDSIRRETPVSMRARARPIGPRRLFSGARPRSGPDRAPISSVLALTLKNGLSTSHAGFRHGETRTRTGDTTIFSRARRSSLRAQIPGSYVVSAGVRRSQDVRSLRIFIAVCGNGRRLRPRFGTRAVWAASGSELERGFAAFALRRGSPLARITMGGSARFAVKAGTNAASAPTTVSRPEQA